MAKFSRERLHPRTFKNLYMRPDLSRSGYPIKDEVNWWLINESILLNVWNAKLTETRIFRELSIEIENSLIELKSSLIELKSSLIQLESSLIQLLSSLYMYN